MDITSHLAEKKWTLLVMIPVTVMLFSAILNDVEDLRNYYASADWQRVDATILHTDLIRTEDSDGPDRYTVEATYTYMWDGQEFESNRITQVGDGSIASNSISKSIHGELEKHLKRKNPISIYINPDNPSQSALRRVSNWPMIGFWTCFSFIYLVFLFGLIGLPEKEEFEHEIQSQLRFSYPDQPWKWREAWRNEIVGCDTEEKIKTQTTGTLILSGFLATAFIFICMFSLFIGPFIIIPLIFMFPFFRIGIESVSGTLRQRAMFQTGGAAEFDMKIPAYTGRTLSGRLWGLSALDPKTRLKVNVKCVEKIHLRDDDWSKKTLWKYATSCRLEKTHLTDGLKVEVAIPSDLPDIDWTNVNRKILWVLTVEATDKKVSFRRDLELPIFNKESILIKKAKQAPKPT